MEALTSSEEGSAAESDGGVVDAEAEADSAEAEAEAETEGSVSEAGEAETKLETAEEAVDVVEAEGTTLPDSGEQAATMESEVEDESTEVQHAQDGDVAEVSGHTKPTLKDLILRLATQVKPKPQQPEHEEEDVTEDTLNLRKFENILSELIAKDREIKHPSDEEHATETPETPEDESTEGSPIPEEPIGLGGACRGGGRRTRC